MTKTKSKVANSKSKQSKKPSVAEAREFLPPAPVQVVDTIPTAQTIRAASLRVLASLEKLEADYTSKGRLDDNAIQQNALTDLYELSQIGDFIEKTLGRFEKLAKAARVQLNPVIEPGRVAVDFTVRDTCSPKWKDEAISAAKQLAEAVGQPFDPELYVTKVQAGTPRSQSVSVKLNLKS